MKSDGSHKSIVAVFALLWSWNCGAADFRLLRTTELPPLPKPIANNAVASVPVGTRDYIVSFSGIGSGLTSGDVLSDTYVLDASTMVWTEAGPVPGGTGRLASTAASVDGLAYVFGGYSVAENGTEVSTPWVHSFDPVAREFAELAPMPVPVDDAVSVSFADRYIYLISGWHDLGNVNLVQRYDTVTNTWDQATPIPGTPVFGHAGGIIGNRIVWCDGVAVRPFPDKSRDFVAHRGCFLGTIDKEDSRRIDWRTMDAHPGPPRYRMAAAGIDALGAILFVGGSENPYNYNGIGYDGQPSGPVGNVLLFDLDDMEWRAGVPDSDPTMDHRGLVRLDDWWLTVGGILAGQKVTDKVVAYSIKR